MFFPGKTAFFAGGARYNAREPGVRLRLSPPSSEGPGCRMGNRDTSTAPVDSAGKATHRKDVQEAQERQGAEYSQGAAFFSSRRKRWPMKRVLINGATRTAVAYSKFSRSHPGSAPTGGRTAPPPGRPRHWPRGTDASGWSHPRRPPGHGGRFPREAPPRFSTLVAAPRLRDGATRGVKLESPP